MSQWASLYKSAAWQWIRRKVLLAEPLCRMCKALGKIKGAQVVDHIIAHKGDLKLFLDEENLQPLCKKCHDSHKQRQERSGYLVGHDLAGKPLDPNHHWNKKS